MKNNVVFLSLEEKGSDFKKTKQKKTCYFLERREGCFIDSLKLIYFECIPLIID